jgi:GTP-binding protein HflX
VDSSHPNAADQIQAVQEVLEEIGAANKPTLVILNKIDRILPPCSQARLLEQHPRAVAISATTREGFPLLLEELGNRLRPQRELLELEVPHSAAGVIARLHAVGQVIERRYTSRGARFRARIPPHLRAEFAPFLVREGSAAPAAR